MRMRIFLHVHSHGVGHVLAYSPRVEGDACKFTSLQLLSGKQTTDPSFNLCVCLFMKLETERCIAYGLLLCHFIVLCLCILFDEQYVCKALIRGRIQSWCVVSVLSLYCVCKPYTLGEITTIGLQNLVTSEIFDATRWALQNNTMRWSPPALFHYTTLLFTLLWAIFATHFFANESDPRPINKRHLFYLTHQD